MNGRLERTKDTMPARVRAAVEASAWGPSLFPRWTFTVSKTLGRLTIRAPGAPIAAEWHWDAGMSDEAIAVAVEMLVVMYLGDLKRDHGIDWTPAVA